ncbi:MAG: putative peptide modification system cyclase, partial [Arenimonas sp.]|uniref:putative peptide modification system cyclase n=1 Tax=Arenimonas sp. TaxID=1872635 RepID=UPI0025BB9719
MNAPPSPATHALNTAPVTPMLRTVLLCDIVESTALVERLGDLRAVALLKRHDQLLRQLIDLCHGQLIDKADGVLALFERPIQALDFALRYQRGLRELGALEALDLKARIGLHVGDVMTWANEPKDVLAGSKAFEVEGLAKPVAARLMNLALPGQILMSGMAQNLCHRAMGELGEAGGRLRWLMHGRYNFKGVPAPMLVHEVGEPGLSPLRAPESGAKAWRELPVWRRPPMLALEVILVAVLGVGLFWTALRSPPAIAFAERDWVVVADLQNRTDEKIFDQSLDTALRVGLEQSRHVNLISELQVDRALERMQRQGQPVDRQLAAELALREGAKAVILPTIAEVGGVVRISLEVVDPNTGVTVYSESADGSGTGNVLPALDIAMAKVRGRLGEAVGSIESTSLPLELVTTGNLDALRAYSLGLRARYEARLDEAQLLFKQAVKLDDQFSMAYLQLAFMRYIDNDAAATRHYLALAEANRTH